MFVPALSLLAPRMHPPSPQRALVTCSTAWSDEETWALVDTAPSFTAGRDANAATFWTALVASTPVLARRTPSECAERAAQLAENITAPTGPEPTVLDAWSRLADGRLAGTVDGRSVWLNVEVEGRLSTDPRPDAGYVETVGGRVYELGQPAAGEPRSGGGGGPVAAAAPFGWQGAVPGLATPPEGVASLLASLLAAGLVGFLGGVASQQPPTLPPAAEPAAPAALQAAARAPAATSAAAERVPLTVAEQLARQQLRVDADRLRLDGLRAQAQRLDDSYADRLAALQRRLQADQVAVDSFDERVKADKERLGARIAGQDLRTRADAEGLAELRRVQAAVGGDAPAVQLGVFPAAAEPAAPK